MLKKTIPVGLLLVSLMAASATIVYAFEGCNVCVFELRWGSPGSGNGEFSLPFGVAVDSSGNVYVADESNNRIQKFTSSGVFLTTWGSFGSGDGQFNGPEGVAVDPTSGNVYVADMINQRVQKFTNSGVFITKWGSFESSNGCSTSTPGFNDPGALAVDANTGNVYVVDTFNNRILYFTNTGTFIGCWGFTGSGDGAFNNSRGIAIDSGSGFVYVADTNNDRVSKFTRSGAIDGFGIVKGWGSTGSGDGQFNRPIGIAVDSSGNVYVSDFGNNRVQKFTSSGWFLLKWGSLGSGDGQFSGATGVAVGGSVYVVDRNNNRVQKFGDPTATATTTTTTAPPIPEYPLGLTLLAIFMIIAYGMIKRRTRSRKDL
jgi:tripartite motif-containing protein 71